MNHTINILKELLEYLNRFKKEKGKEVKDVKEFAIWLSKSVFQQDTRMVSDLDENDTDMELTFLLIMQSKYYKTYCKDALANSGINSPDEYSFLYHLSLVDSFRKMELIQIHLLEAPSGIEVIKRLLKKGFIEEFDDNQDKRAKRVKLTEKGREEIKKVTPQMQRVYKKMAAKMPQKEKLQVISLLKEQNDYHSTPKGKRN